MESSAYRGNGEPSNRNVLRYSDIEINPYPNPEEAHRPGMLPVLRIETENGDVRRPESASVLSPTSQQKNFYYGRKKYSLSEDSLRLREMPIFNKARKEKMEGIKIVNRNKNDNEPDNNNTNTNDIVEFDFQRETRRKKGPSSPTTVLTMAGLFVCGSTLLLSGIIILCQQDEQPFVITGSIFLGVGILMMSDSYMWKLMFRDETSTLPPQH